MAARAIPTGSGALAPGQRRSCPACGNGDIQEFLAIENVPVHCNILWSTRAEALRAPRADLRLGLCPRCGLIYNLAFDPALVEYAGSYENSLHFSERFQAYAEELAGRLVERYRLRDKDIVEIGCGDGEFLRLLCRIGGNRGLGFDPSDRPLGSNEDRVRIVHGYYSPAYADHPMDLLCCRHVLEHVAAPRALIDELQPGLERNPGCVIFFEVPNGLLTFREGRVWDVLYEHCSYFTPQSLDRLFRAAGLDPLDLYTTYEDQFLCIEAKWAGSGRPDAAGEDPPEMLPHLVSRFQRTYREALLSWSTRIGEWIERGRRIAVWGAGTKGVMFLNTVEGARHIERVVDINPRKQGSHVAGTGHRIVAPADLSKDPPDVVLVMNPIYEAEIRAALSREGIAADLHTV